MAPSHVREDDYMMDRTLGGRRRIRLTAASCLTALLAIAAFPWSAHGAGPIDEHTLAYWTFDEGAAATVGDASGGGAVGEAADMEWVPGISGTAGSFDGESSQVVVPDGPTLHPESGDITIEAWIRVASDPTGWGPGASGAGGIVFKQDAYQWVVHGELAGTLWFGIWGARLKSTGAYTFADHVDEWRHTALTFDGNSKDTQIYVDGELMSEGVVGEAVDPAGTPLYIGFKADDGVYYHGAIDEVRISDVVRTQAEIRDMMDVTLSVSPRGLLAARWATLKQAQ